MRTPSLARALGLFSVTLGAMEVLMPKRIGRFLGMPAARREAVKGVGLREIATGLGLLASVFPSKLLWLRVAGDVIDMAKLEPGLTRRNPKRGNVALVMLGLAAVTLVDIAAASAAGRRS